MNQKKLKKIKMPAIHVIKRKKNKTYLDVKKLE